MQTDPRSPVLTELRMVYAVRMPGGRLRRYYRRAYAYRRAARLALGKQAGGDEVIAMATRLMRRDARP